MNPGGFPKQVTVVEVGPRDGLQNESQAVPAAVKVELVRRLQQAGLREIEVTSFVSPRWVPQMADNAEVMAAIPRPPGVRHSALTPNLQGFEAARASGVDEIVVFASASETFSQRNINCSIEQSIERYAPVCAAARTAGIRVRGAISCAVVCPYEGDIAPAQVGRVAGLMRSIGVQHAGVADTIGAGRPMQVQAALEASLRHFELDEVSGHFHDTYGMALANVYASLTLGVHRFDASVSGLGGCPYAKGATGNLASEDLVYLLQGLDIDTGIDLDRLVDAGSFIRGALGQANGSRVARALLVRRAN
jgi:hydroxymethylglutaryl-CoA lyase